MTNKLSYTSYPKEKTAPVFKDVITPRIAPDTEIIEVVWGGITGKTNKELEIEYLLHTDKFAAFIKESKEQFIKNPEKFPSMSDDDWEE